ncbi:MAG: 2-amino-4-hydroxy-6-hydroxymethyldihydropteridine diphosphokinase, partial [Candidatus Eremiobacteraeota bacterium]|nr:2-amino-4-hydroxy-6-hydroxymethyldihydropteridine diphosphokinase [Candidatus Eremiobacteraeota bacterium]
MARAYVGLGANLGDARSSVEAALERLKEAGEVVRSSRLYRSAPWGIRDQPQFVNAVALLETSLSPSALLRFLKGLEQQFGRRPGPRFGPRLLDLDLLTYDDVHRDDPELTLPHPRMLERAFVLVPLAEIDSRFDAAAAALHASERAEVVPLDERKRPGPCTPATENEPEAAVEWNKVTRRLRDVAAACSEAGLVRIRVADDEMEFALRRSGTSRSESVSETPLVVAVEPSPSPNGAVEHAQEPLLLRSQVVGVVRFSHPPVAEGALLSDERELASIES